MQYAENPGAENPGDLATCLTGRMTASFQWNVARHWLDGD
jgi:hypothetical protein